MSISVAPASLRDGQVRSEFTEILERVVASSVGAIAAVLVDETGEAVDLAGRMNAFDIKVAAAHWQIVLRDLVEHPHLAAARSVMLRTEVHGYVVHKLFNDYVLVMIGRPAAAFSLSPRALRAMEMELAVEAGYAEQHREGQAWIRVLVMVGPEGRPSQLVERGHSPERLQQVGEGVELAEFERSYSVRTADGRGLELVRERSGVWYATDRET